MQLKTALSLIYTTILFSTKSLAQNATINGIVVDNENNNAIENATIIVKEKTKIFATDTYGGFNIKKLTAGNYTIEISHIGYATKQVALNLTENSIATLKIGMDKSNITFSTINVTSNKFNAYSKISSIDLLFRPVNSSQDVLRMVPSLFIAQHAGGGKAEQIFLRGFDIDHGTDISITVDGMPVNMISHAHGQGYADLHFLIPETIDKVNFDKGPYNAEKGNLATAGFVDFKTKDFITNNSLKIEAGKFNMQRISGQLKLLSSNKNNNNQQLYVASEYSTSDGYFVSPQNFKRFNIMGKYSLIKNDNTKLNILLSTFQSKWNASGQIPERAVKDGSINNFGAIDDTEGGLTSRTNFSIQYSKKLNNNWEIAQQGYYTNYNFNLFSNFTFFLNDPIDGDMINQKEQRNIYGYWAKAKKLGTILDKKTTTTFGAGFRHDDVGTIDLANTPKRIFKSYVQQGSIKETNAFAYINKTIDINNNFSINGSLRFDYFTFGYKNALLGEERFNYINKSVFSPKLNLNYNVSKKVSVCISNGIGFHSNDTRVILSDSIKNILPKVYGTDIGITAKPTKNLYVKTILWHLFSEQEFVYVGDAGVVEPSAASRRFGVDVITRYQINKWLYSDIDISIAKARSVVETKGKDYIPLAPLFTSIGGLTAKVNNKFSASLRYRFMGTRPASEDYSVIAKGYFLIDAVANYKYKKFDFSVTMENLLNQQWKEAQFNTESRLFNEANSVSEIHYTPGSPFFVKAGVALSF
jgi:CarboxypepD_reg-like domain/TonB-dependent Receptor Plug Domain